MSNTVKAIIAVVVVLAGLYVIIGVTQANAAKDRYNDTVRISRGIDG